MTISNETREASISSGSTITITNFEIQNDDQITVTKVDSNGTSSTLVKDTDYTVDANLTTVTLTTALAASETATAEVDVPLTQSTDFTPTGSFNPDNVETALDKLTLMAKASNISTTEFMRTIAGESGTLGRLPSLTDSGGKYLTRNSANNGWTFSSLTSGATGLTEIVEDTTPQFGGDIDFNGYNALIDDGNGLHDDSDNEYIRFQKTASAVNQFDITNAATGNNPIFESTGDDTNVGIDFQGKGTGTFNFKATASQQSEIRMYEDTDNGTNYVAIKPPASLAADYTLTLPADDGTSGQVLSTDGSGVLSWVAAATGAVQQIVNTTYATYSSHTTTIPLDDTVPQNTEGEEIMTLAITPGNASNVLIIEVNLYGALSSSTSRSIAGLYQDSTANALEAAISLPGGSGVVHNWTLKHIMTAGTTSATTFKVRVGPNTGTLYMNGDSSARKMGGVMKCSITITEYST